MAPSTETVPIVDYLVLEPDGEAHLEANRCASSGALFFDRRNACAACGRRTFERAALGTTGSLKAYTIVWRSAPNVPAPYVSAVVELDGGGVVKANLVEAPAEPDRIVLGGPVRLVTFVAGRDDDGTEAIAFGFAQVAPSSELNGVTP